MGRIVQKQTKILRDNVRRNLIGTILLFVLTLAMPFIHILLDSPTLFQIGGLAALIAIGLAMAVFTLSEYIKDRRLYRAISEAPSANEERTITCRKIRLRTYATSASRYHHSSDVWAIVLIDENETKYTYVLEKVMTLSTRNDHSVKQKLLGKELTVLCYQNTNIIKKIRDLKL